MGHELSRHSLVDGLPEAEKVTQADTLYTKLGGFARFRVGSNATAVRRREG